MSAISTNFHDKYIPEIWTKQLLAEFHPRLFLNYITNTNYEGEIKNQGDVVKIRKKMKPTVGDYTLLSGGTYSQISVQDMTAPSTVDLEIDKAKYYAFNAYDIEQHQSDVNYISAALEEAALGIKEALESDVINSVYASADSANTGATAGKKSSSFNLGTAPTDQSAAGLVSLTGGSAGTVVNWIIDCGTVLDEQNVPENDRFIVLPPAIVNRIKKSDIREVYITGDKESSLRTGNIGMIDRFHVFQSNVINTKTKTISDVTHTYWIPIFGQKSAITFATQLVKNEVVTLEKQFGKMQRGLCVYGYKVVQPTCLGCSYVKIG